MAGAQLAIAQLGLLGLAAIAAGLVVRRRYARCWAYTAYVVVVLVGELLTLAWPDPFYTRSFWLVRQTAYSMLKFAIALELALRTFRAFPGAQAVARRAVFLVLAATLLAIVSVPAGSADLADVATVLHARVLNGTIWLFTAIAGVILWYRLPVDAFHKAVLIGFVPYLLVFTTLIQLLNTYGWQLQRYATYADPIAYIVLLAYWTYAAWRRVPARAGHARAAPAGPLLARS